MSVHRFPALSIPLQAKTIPDMRYLRIMMDMMMIKYIIMMNMENVSEDE